MPFGLTMNLYEASPRITKLPFQFHLDNGFLHFVDEGVQVLSVGPVAEDTGSQVQRAFHCRGRDEEAPVCADLLQEAAVDVVAHDGNTE